MFISFEGPDGSGKSTQIELLASALRASGHEVVTVREPGGTPAGEKVRAILLGEGGAVSVDPRADALLFNASRAQLVADVIEPALARGAIVIADRFADSTLAYQGYGSELPLDALRAIITFATAGRTPDLTLLLDLAADEGLARKSGSGRTRFEDGFDAAFHARVAEGFRALAAAEPTRWRLLDASAAPEALAAQISQAVQGALATRR
ncbi:MAG: dTMP kinase [bacterium Ellin6529]|jgi:dTMP kinase|uniref:dTMP kinase n=1 Tax=Candidatus Limnocylindrus sp. TaxID=2802978 RepID=UPI002790D153|nr:dTMP kinase [bacterium Ellin6529]